MVKSLIDEVQLDLGVVHIILLNKPNVLSSVEVLRGVTLLNHLRGANVGHCLKPVHQEDITNLLLLTEVKNTEERVLFSLSVTELYTSKLVIDTNAVVAT